MTESPTTIWIGTKRKTALTALKSQIPEFRLLTISAIANELIDRGIADCTNTRKKK